MSCEFQDQCPLYRNFHIPAVARLWRVMYCEHASRHKACARVQAHLRGEKVSPRLMPNGDLLAVAQRDPVPPPTHLEPEKQAG